MGKHEKRGKKKKRIWPKVLISILVVIAIIFSGGYFYIHNKLSKMNKVEIDKADLGISQDISTNYNNTDKIKNIALFGVDAPDGENGRSDSIMIATIDPVHKKLKLTSIMRDSYVNIPDRGLDKINHAYAFGGPQLAIKTINENFGLNIEDYMTVNFSSLPIIIDALGGVDITITDEEVSHIPGISSAGTYTLTGDQALAYSRIRYAEGGDYKRTERQRTVLEGLFAKALSMPASSYVSILDTVLPYVQTNMSSSTILSIGTKALTSFEGQLEQQRFPLDGYCEGEMIDGVYYLTFDAETTKQQFMDYIFKDTLE
ncbi:LCP family protein [Clostridium culturomicium]|uniref:LCP family protein n=1 Tax=Clostridium culturomicium TaxID=1499683 RepID=UPI00059090C7|nr:LCP family protein [Clostridium culturomicium]